MDMDTYIFIGASLISHLEELLNIRDHVKSCPPIHSIHTYLSDTTYTYQTR